jgi:hypothetical protein
MKSNYTIKINFLGGIISPGDLYNILVASTKAEVYHVRFGLRQQLLIDISGECIDYFTGELDKLGVVYEKDKDDYPNVISSYAAEEIFIHNTWLSEGTYKDIFDGIDYRPRLKINVSDSNQSFTPMLTGNINWVASPSAQHFWHLFIRFPKTNVIYEWKDMVYTNDVARMSKQLETIIFRHRQIFYDNKNADGDMLYGLLQSETYITKPSAGTLKLPPFNLPYYEGLNRYNNKYWLGIYRRDELFDLGFLKDLCKLCLRTKIGQVCSTPWKSIIVKGIEEKDRQQWNDLLAKYQVNVRHAANELNFQVEDNCKEGLALKTFLVKYLSIDDMRTFGICFGIKTRKKSEVFCNVLIKKRSLLSIGKWGFFNFYDVLIARDFNPNERTGSVFSSSNFKMLLPEQMRRVVLAFYNYQAKQVVVKDKKPGKKDKPANPERKEYVFQCKHCKTICDEMIGPDIIDELPAGYICPLCEAPEEEILRVEKSSLGLQTV